MKKPRKYPCEGCDGLIKELRRTKCKKCGILFCEHHIFNHECSMELMIKNYSNEIL